MVYEELYFDKTLITIFLGFGFGMLIIGIALNPVLCAISRMIIKKIIKKTRKSNGIKKEKLI